MRVPKKVWLFYKIGIYEYAHVFNTEDEAIEFARGRNEITEYAISFEY